MTAEDGVPLPPEARPLGTALQQQRATHGVFRIQDFNGISQSAEVTAFPLAGQGVATWARSRFSGRGVSHGGVYRGGFWAPSRLPGSKRREHRQQRRGEAQAEAGIVPIIC